MSKRKKDELIGDSLTFIERTLKSLKDTISKKERESIEESIQKTQDIRQFISGTKRVLTILGVIVLLLISTQVMSLYYIDELKTTNAELETQQIDSIINQILEIKTIDTDSTILTTYDYRTRDGKIVSYRQLSIEKDSLANEYLTLSKELKDTERENYILDAKLKFLQEKYDLDLNTTLKDLDNGTIQYIFSANSKRIDSALILLNRYRDYLYYDDESKAWYILPNKIPKK